MCAQMPCFEADLCRPIPIPLHPATFASLPKLTLESGLAQTLLMNGNQALMPRIGGYDSDIDMSAGTSAVAHHDQSRSAANLAGGRESSKTFRDKKAAGLKIRTDTPYKLVLRTTQSGLPRSATLAIRSARGLSRYCINSWTNRFTQRRKEATDRKKASKLQGKSLKMGLVGMGMGMLRFGQGVGRRGLFQPGSAVTEGRRTSRRVSFGGWEVR